MSGFISTNPQIKREPWTVGRCVWQDDLERIFSDPPPHSSDESRHSGISKEKVSRDLIPTGAWENG